MKEQAMSQNQLDRHSASELLHKGKRNCKIKQ